MCNLKLVVDNIQEQDEVQTLRRRKHVEANKRYRERNILKYKAHNAVNNAIRDGKLVRPQNCEHCGQIVDKLQAHHSCYAESEWLKVVWLCTPCHGKKHIRLGKLSKNAQNKAA